MSGPAKKPEGARLKLWRPMRDAAMNVVGVRYVYAAMAQDQRDRLANWFPAVRFVDFLDEVEVIIPSGACK
ncbi:hypothetical protein NKJ26_03000 [Mesorhizobium sp. M0152]|uniref:hypothetical protein n=1 Tax=Mesorhizobium sp. M0152 TaxID=2956898 RepID=UPI00333A4258